MLTVRLEHDSDLESPMENDGSWTLYSFCSRHINFKHPTEALNMPGLKRKLKSGLAHVLSYFEHGNCLWFRKDGDIPAGVEFMWDGVEVAGLLVWENPAKDMGAKTFEDRAKDADGFLKEYTSWCNGEGYYFSIEDEDGQDVDSCGGFLGDPGYMLTEIAAQLKGQEFEVEGDASYLEDDLRRIVPTMESQPA